MRTRSSSRFLVRNGVMPVLALVLLTLPCLSPAARAEPPAAPTTQGTTPDRPPRQQMGLAGLAKTLDLSQEQVEQMQTIRQEFLKETADLKNEIYKKKLELSSLIRDPQASDAQILALQKQAIALKSQMMEKAAESMLKSRRLLTPDQIKKLPARSCGMGFMGEGRKDSRRLGEAP